MRWAIAAMLAVLGVFQASAQTLERRPNIVLILVDDAALMDFGVYGGEARTPNIDALAAGGALFTQYYTSPLCSPSRAMLLTGMDNHLTGIATIPEVLPKEHVGQPGYTMHLEPGVLTLADRLGTAGYRTLMAGKWHLGSGEGDLPNHHGFDRSFALDASGADNWDDKSYMPYYADAPWYEDGAPASLPEDFYSSTFIVDRMIDYVEQGSPETPVFAYLAFQAIHIPVQAPPEITASYDGVYDEGWHELRYQRWLRARQLGLIPQDAPLAAFPENFRTWDSLSEEEQAVYAARMQVNAAMMEAMDGEIGRFIAYLSETDRLENTIFVVTSDNGPEPSRGDDDWRLSLWMKTHGYHIGIDGVGEAGSWGFIGPEWAMAAASPHNLFKFLAAEGGIRAPLIVTGAGVPAGERIEGRAMVSDIAPTLIEMAGVDPGEAGMTGRSLAPMITGAAESVYGAEDVIGIEVSGNSAIVKGRWKITRNQLPHGDGQWRLYDIEADPGEVRDLSAAEPDVFEDMLAEYAAYSTRVGVLEVPEGYDQAAQIAHNAQKKQLKRYAPWLAAIALGLIALVYLLVRWWRRRRVAK